MHTVSAMVFSLQKFGIFPVRSRGKHAFSASGATLARTQTPFPQKLSVSIAPCVEMIVGNKLFMKRNMVILDILLQTYNLCGFILA